jgi:hypothetical protein
MSLTSYNAANRTSVEVSNPSELYVIFPMLTVLFLFEECANRTPGYLENGTICNSDVRTPSATCKQISSIPLASLLRSAVAIS